MAPEIRSILRYMDEYLGTGDYSSAIEKATQALQLYDQERQYEDSIMLLEKLISIAEAQRKPVDMAKYVDNLRVRVMLVGDKQKLEEINQAYSHLPQTPIGELLKGIWEDDAQIIVETIERQTIFGDFEPIPNVPFLEFNHQDEALGIIEQFYDQGRYIINLLDRSTSLHQALNLDLGNPEEVNILDRDRIFKLH